MFGGGGDGRQETMVRTYKDMKAYQHDAKKLGKQGWQIITSAEHKNRIGVGRIAMLGPFSLLRPPKSDLVVSYTRFRPGKNDGGNAQSAPMSPAMSPGAFQASPVNFVACPRCNGAVPVESHFCPGCGLQRFNPPS